MSCYYCDKESGNEVDKLEPWSVIHCCETHFNKIRITDLKPGDIITYNNSPLFIGTKSSICKDNKCGVCGDTFESEELQTVNGITYINKYSNDTTCIDCCENSR